jgi:hypothetical protein
VPCDFPSGNQRSQGNTTRSGASQSNCVRLDSDCFSTPLASNFAHTRRARQHSDNLLELHHSACRQLDVAALQFPGAKSLAKRQSALAAVNLFIGPMRTAYEPPGSTFKTATFSSLNVFRAAGRIELLAVDAPEKSADVSVAWMAPPSRSSEASEPNSGLFNKRFIAALVRFGCTTRIGFRGVRGRSPDAVGGQTGRPELFSKDGCGRAIGSKPKTLLTAMHTSSAANV